MSLASTLVSAEWPRPQIPTINLHGKLLSHQTGFDGPNAASKTPIIKENSEFSSEYAPRSPSEQVWRKFIYEKAQTAFVRAQVDVMRHRKLTGAVLLSSVRKHTMAGRFPLRW